MNLKINPGAATDTALGIQKIVEEIEEDMKQLDLFFKKTEEDIKFDWADKLRENWSHYFQNNIPEVMADMLQSAKNLNTAVEEVLAYSQEQGQ